MESFWSDQSIAKATVERKNTVQMYFYEAILQKDLPGDEDFLLCSSQKRATAFCDV